MSTPAPPSMATPAHVPPFEGWWIPTYALKHHYFREGKSLCRAWGGLDGPGPFDRLTAQPYNEPCKTCERKAPTGGTR